MFTFKTINPTGKWRSFENPEHNIKLDKKEVGTIDPERPFKIRLMVIKKDINEDGNPNCPWKWITLIKNSDTLLQAKHFLNDHFEEIIKEYNLYKRE